MSALVIILLGTVLIQGSALVLGGTTPPVQARMSLSMELREAAFTMVTLTLSAVMGFIITHYILDTLQLDYLRTPVIVVTVATIIIIARAVTGRQDSQHQVLVLLTNQCALLGIALFTASFADSVPEAFLYGLVSACALAILSAAFKALMERVNTNSIPIVFRGIPLALISAGLLALALMGFAGFVHN